MLKSDITTRHANQSDIPLILSLIQKKAEFDRSTGSFNGTLKATEEKLAETLFNESPFARVLFAENLEKVVGFALYYFRYSSFAAQPSLWLDDLYVDSDMRSRGVGCTLMNRLAEIAQESQCKHMGWTAIANNPRGLQFYKRLGAEVVSQKGEILFFQANHLKLLDDKTESNRLSKVR